MQGNRIKLSKHTKTFNILREIRDCDVPINQKQDALILEPSKNKKEELKIEWLKEDLANKVGKISQKNKQKRY